jgi:hypothetical protein
VQGAYLVAGPTATDDGRCAQLEGREVDAEGVGVVRLGVERKAPAHRRDRHLPADDQPLAANSNFDPGPERHPGLGSVSTPGPIE